MKPARARHGTRRACAVLAMLAGCSSTPPPPDWQINALSAITRANTAYLRGQGGLETQEIERARRELAATGRIDLVARIELMHCAARVASLDFAPCAGFDALRSDAAAPELAYAAYLAGAIASADIERLPVQHRAPARAPTPDAALGTLQSIEDPLARLVGAAVLLRTQRASPDVVTLAVDTASAQGWRRALLAWLGIQAQRAQATGDTAALERIRRRIALVGGSP